MKRIFSIIASLGLVALMLGVTTSAALAWQKPVLAANGCWAQDGLYGPAWTVTLSGTESSYDFDFAPSTAGPWIYATGHEGVNDIHPKAGWGATMVVRWDADKGVASSVVTNDSDCAPPLATVTLHKAITSDPAGPNVPGDFGMNLGNTDPTTPTVQHGVDGDVLDVVPGTYVLTEDQLPGYSSADGAGCYDSTPADNSVKAPVALSTFTFVTGHSYVCGFNNQYTPPTGSITFHKIISGTDKGGAALSAFTFTLTGPLGGRSATFKDGDVKSGLPLLSYTVSETSIPTNYVLDMIQCTPDQVTEAVAPLVTTNSTPILSADHPDWTCTITNIYVAPSPSIAPSPSVAPSTPPCTTCGCLGNCPSPSPSVSPSPSASPSPSVSPSPSPSVAPSIAPSAAPSVAPPASPEITPPPTSTVGSADAPSSGSILLAFLLLAAVCGGSLTFARKAQ